MCMTSFFYYLLVLCVFNVFLFLLFIQQYNYFQFYRSCVACRLHLHTRKQLKTNRNKTCNVNSNVAEDGGSKKNRNIHIIFILFTKSINKEYLSKVAHIILSSSKGFIPKFKKQNITIKFFNICFTLSIFSSIFIYFLYFFGPT